MRVCLICLLISLAGCAQPEWPYYGNAADQVIATGVPLKKLMTEVHAAFRRHGFKPVDTFNPQEPTMVPTRSAGRVVAAFVRGGQSSVRVFAVPLRNGWSLVAASEPGGRNTFYPQGKVREILREAVARAAGTSGPLTE